MPSMRQRLRLCLVAIPPFRITYILNISYGPTVAPHYARARARAPINHPPDGVNN